MARKAHPWFWEAHNGLLVVSYDCGGRRTAAGLLAALYRDVLHRRPGAPAGDTLGRLLREGVAPGAVAAWVVNSPEARAKFVRGLSLQVLHHPAAAPGCRINGGFAARPAVYSAVVSAA